MRSNALFISSSETRRCPGWKDARGQSSNSRTRWRHGLALAPCISSLQFLKEFILVFFVQTEKPEYDVEHVASHRVNGQRACPISGGMSPNTISYEERPSRRAAGQWRFVVQGQRRVVNHHGSTQIGDFRLVLINLALAPDVGQAEAVLRSVQWPR